MIAYFERFEIQMTKKQALQGSHLGRCDDDIQQLLELPTIKRQFSRIDHAKIQAELKEYGAWDEQELSNIQENQARILWIACGNIREEIRK